MAKAKQEEKAGMDLKQITSTVKRALERQLNTTATLGPTAIKVKGNTTTFKLEISVDNVQMQLLPVEGDSTAQDDLPMTDA